MFKLLLAGFTINLLTSIDDAMTRIPVLSANTRTTKGRLAFTCGNLLAVTVAIGLAFGVSQFLETLPNSNYIIATLVFILAAVVFFDLIRLQPPKKVREQIEQSQISRQRVTKLVGIGFVMTFITMIDDIFALAPLLNGSLPESISAIIGIYLASLLLAFGVLFFSEKISALPHKRLLASGTLVLFGILLLLGVI